MCDVDQIVETLLEIALDPEARAADRIRAGSELFDRGWGKAPQFAPMDSGDDDPLGRDEIDLEIQALVEQLMATRPASPEAN